MLLLFTSLFTTGSKGRGPKSHRLLSTGDDGSEDRAGVTAEDGSFRILSQNDFKLGTPQNSTMIKSCSSWISAGFYMSLHSYKECRNQKHCWHPALLFISWCSFARVPRQQKKVSEVKALTILWLWACGAAVLSWPQSLFCHALMVFSVFLISLWTFNPLTLILNTPQNNKT